MAFAQGSRSQLAFKAETTVGTPVTVDTVLPINTHSLNLTKERVAGNEIQADRMARVDRHGNKQAGGDIVVDLRKDTYDEFILSALLSTDTFASNGDAATVGTTPSFFTIEDQMLDINKARKFTSMHVSSMAMSIAPNQMVQTTFGFVGTNMVSNQTPTSVTPAASNPIPVDAYTGTISVGGSTVALITSMDLSLNNNFSPAFVIGSASAAEVNYGRATVEGSISAYVEDTATLYDLFVDETESSIEVQVLDLDGNGYTFTVPRAKLNGGDIPLGGEEARIVTMPFVGLYDSTAGTNLKVTKVVA